MKYPGHVVKAGEADARIVRALKRQLNTVLTLDAEPGLRLDPANPTFGPKMKQVVKLFQARHVDGSGRPLKTDGEVGSLTWSALFGAGTVSASTSSASELLNGALEIAAAEEARGVREVPRNSNSGPEVDAYLRRVGLGPGYAWCCAFMFWCMDEAAKSRGRSNPMVKTAGCLDHWSRAKARGAERILKRSMRAIVKNGLRPH